MTAVQFRPLARADFPLLQRWRTAPHAARWFDPPLDDDGMERKYGPRVDGTEPTRVYVVSLDGTEAGIVQTYRIADHPEYAAACGHPDAAGVDILIGEVGWTGRGAGPLVIERFLAEVVGPAYPDLAWCVASIDVLNPRSRRAFAKAGFDECGTAVGDLGPEVVVRRPLSHG